jgi:hypothetical protein
VPATDVTFEFEFDSLYRRVAMAWGVTPDRAFVRVTGEELLVRFGPWSLRTPRSNVVGTEVTGPYAVPKTIGPARLSLADRGVTFATNARRGLCVRFREPVRGIDPLGLVRHPGMTVTVRDVDGLRAALAVPDTD